MVGGIISKLKFARAFLIAVRDPHRAEEIFKVTGDKRIMGGGNHQLVFEKLARSPEANTVLRERRLANWNLDDLSRMPAGTLGRWDTPTFIILRKTI